VKKARKLVLWCALIFGLLVLIAGGIERCRGARAYHTRLNELKLHGEKLSVAELKPEVPPTNQNAALEVLDLSNRVSAVVSNLGSVPPSLRFVEPGKAIVNWRAEWWADSKTTNTWRQIDAGLATDPGLRKSVREVLERAGFDTGFDYDKGFVDFHSPPLLQLKQLVEWQSVSVAADLHAGRSTDARDQLLDALRLVERQKSERLIISQLVRIACGSILWNSTWAALQSPGWTEEQLAPVQAAWQRLDFLTDMIAGCEMERAMTIEHYKQLRASRAARASFIAQTESGVELLGAEFYTLPSRGFILRWLHVPLWRLVWLDQDALHALERWQSIIAGGRIAQRQSWTEARRSLEQGNELPETVPLLSGSPLEHPPSHYDRWRFLVANEPFSIGGTMILRTAKADTQRNLAIAAIAIERYRLRHGGLPHRLDSLIPDFLAAAPRDYLNGEPLKYSKRENGTFALYSVGENGKDDGGNPSQPPEKVSFRQIWDGLDAVWPSPASVEEAQQAMIRGEK